MSGFTYTCIVAIYVHGACMPENDYEFHVIRIVLGTIKERGPSRLRWGGGSSEPKNLVRAWPYDHAGTLLEMLFERTCGAYPYTEI